MRKLTFVAVMAVFCSFCYAESGRILDDGSVFVVRNKGDFEDDIKIINKTNSVLTVSVKGTRKRSGKPEFIGSQRINIGSAEKLHGDFSGRMDLFSDFTFTFFEGNVKNFETSLSGDDLYISINRIDDRTDEKESAAPVSDSALNLENSDDDIAGKILKYKKLLDMGAITQQEFDLLKKKLLDF